MKNEEIKRIKEEIKQAVKGLGGKADLLLLADKFKDKIDLTKLGFDNFTQLLRSFQDVFDIERDTVTLKTDSFRLFGMQDDFLEIQNFSTSINLDESNDNLLFDDVDDSSSSSSNTTVYKEVQNSVKMPLQQQEYTGAQQLNSDSESNDSERHYNKMIEKIYDSSDKVKEDISQVPSVCSLEGLSSIDGDDLEVDENDIEKILGSDISVDGQSGSCSLNEFILSLPVDDELFYSHLPPVNRDEKATVPQQRIEKDFANRVAYLSEIFDPIHFWFQLVHGDDKYENFDTFHNKFNLEYKSLKEQDLMISDDNYKEGLIVACFLPQFKHWYRARIIHIFEKTVRLFFIDYGTNAVCKKELVKYLYKHFMEEYPQYCFRGRVAGIVPVNNVRSFKFSQIEEFVKKISHYSFSATVVKHEEEEDVYQLELIRRRGDVNVREYLIENNLAEPMNPCYNDSAFSIGPPSYLIPSFTALECDYPTYAQLENLSRADVNFDLLIDHNFLHTFRRHEIEENEELQVIVQHPRFSSLKKYFYGCE